MSLEDESVQALYKCRLELYVENNGVWKNGDIDRSWHKIKQNT